jgi:hypothetical protein
MRFYFRAGHNGGAMLAQGDPDGVRKEAGSTLWDADAVDC